MRIDILAYRSHFLLEKALSIVLVGQAPLCAWRAALFGEWTAWDATGSSGAESVCEGRATPVTNEKNPLAL